jgi:hypothetical protein
MPLKSAFRRSTVNVKRCNTTIKTRNAAIKTRDTIKAVYPCINDILVDAVNKINLSTVPVLNAAAADDNRSVSSVSSGASAKSLVKSAPNINIKKRNRGLSSSSLPELIENFGESQRNTKESRNQGNQFKKAKLLKPDESWSTISNVSSSESSGGKRTKRRRQNKKSKKTMKYRK